MRSVLVFCSSLCFFPHHWLTPHLSDGQQVQFAMSNRSEVISTPFLGQSFICTGNRGLSKVIFPTTALFWSLDFFASPSLASFWGGQRKSLPLLGQQVPGGDQGEHKPSWHEHDGARRALGHDQHAWSRQQHKHDFDGMLSWLFAPAVCNIKGIREQVRIHSHTF